MKYPMPAAARGGNDLQPASREMARAARVLGALLLCTGATLAQGSMSAYRNMAPIAQYQMPSRDAEIALARSAAPASISSHAQVLVLGSHDYETAIKGTNGFVCLVMRSWDQSFDHPEFWNPKIRGPECINPAAVRSVLPVYLARTRWVLAGDSVAQMRVLTRHAFATGKLRPPEPGAMAYMMSEDGYLSDANAGPWHPHVMFMMPPTPATVWGANLAESPVAADTTGHDGMTFFFAVVPKWSNGKWAWPQAGVGGQGH